LTKLNTILDYDTASLSPEEVLTLQVQEFNKGNTDFLMTLYENEACFAPRPGEIDSDLANIRKSFQALIDMGTKLQANAKRVLYSSDLALMITEWALEGTDPGGKSINLKGRGTIVFRRQPDGNWLMVIENPWGTD
jgi:ketosteroid isomerase-like protein